MPGPSNIKKRRKSHTKNQKKKSGKPRPSLDSQAYTSTTYDSRSPSPLTRSPSQLVTPPPPSIHFPSPVKEVIADDDGGGGYYTDAADELVPQTPYIYDPGNGPRVRDTRAFLTSSYFSQPPALGDPLCAEFAQDEVLQMFYTVLPEETALILWYNKSRATSRICPACQRLYRLGDVLPDHMDDEHERIDKRPPPQLEREQELSGLCSPVCFILASFNYPGAIKSAWGNTAEDMDDGTWALLNSPGEGHTHGDISSGLGMLVKMTRLHDLGLAQFCLPDVDFDELASKEGRVGMHQRAEVTA